jgi:hypothetical protein
LHGGFHQAPLDLVAIGPRRQLKLGVEGMNARLAGAPVPHPGDRDRTEQGNQATSVQASVGEKQRGAVRGVQAKGDADIPAATTIEMRLQEQPQQLAAAPLGLPLDLWEPQALGRGRAQPGFEAPESL